MGIRAASASSTVSTAGSGSTWTWIAAAAAVARSGRAAVRRGVDGELGGMRRSVVGEYDAPGLATNRAAMISYWSRAVRDDARRLSRSQPPAAPCGRAERRTAGRSEAHTDAGA